MKRILFISTVTIVFFLCTISLHAGDLDNNIVALSKKSKHVVRPIYQCIMDAINRGKNIDVNERVGGRVALIGAASAGNIGAVKFFLSRGADINLRDCFGHTALAEAIYKRQHTTALYLLKKGASRYTFDMFGTPMMKIITYDDALNPDVNGWYPKELLVALQGECVICLEEIDEEGHIYVCGHSVHKACKTEKCSLCR